MAGSAKTTDFLLGTATVMFGPMDEVFDLNPKDHGVGLTKSVSVTAEPSFTDLTQGVKNQSVYSVMTGNVVGASCEVYEYTASNILYAAGLDGSAHVAPTGKSTLASAITPADTDFDVETGEGSEFSVGDWVVIEGTSKDQIYVRKVKTIATDSITVDGDPFPAAVAAGSVVRAASVIEVGSKQDQPFMGCKIVGTLADGDTIGLVFPKIRITNGFNLSFMSDDFQNMPFEMSMYDLVTSDDLYDTFEGAQGLALV